jgi:hypothetical protein
MNLEITPKNAVDILNRDNKSAVFRYVRSCKNVDTQLQVQDTLTHGLWFDGSSRKVLRILESDMLLNRFGDLFCNSMDENRQI